VATLSGPSEVQVARRADYYQRRIVSAIRKTLRVIADGIDGNVTLDDLAIITHEWSRHVGGLLDVLRESYVDAATNVRREQHDALVTVLKRNAVTADAAPPRPFEVPLTQADQATVLLSDAENRLRDVSNEVWEITRSELVLGMQAGEGVRDLRARITGSTELMEPRAGVIARTEVNTAMNAGSLAQMRQLDSSLDLTKEWIAAGGPRTRPAHARANGQRVPLNEKFDIDGEAVDAPGGGSPSNSINCRCTLGFDVPDEQLVQSVCGCGDAVLLASASLTAAIGGELGAVCACDATLITQVRTLTTSRAVPNVGDNARYSIIPGKMISKAALKRAGISSGAEQQRIIDLNQVFMTRFGTYFEKVESTYGGPVGTDALAYVRNGNILGVSPDLLRDSIVRVEQQKGWFISGTGRIEDVMVHEYGHFLFGRFGPSAWNDVRRNTAFIKAESAARAVGMPAGHVGSTVSGYAATSANEAKAELWAFYHMGGARRPQWVITWGRTLLHELGLDPTPLCKDLKLC